MSEYIKREHGTGYVGIDKDYNDVRDEGNYCNFGERKDGDKE